MKKVLSFLLSIVMLCSCVGSIQMTAAAAGEYIATDIPLNGQWSEDYWITETDDERQWFCITIPSDGYLELRLMSYSFTRLQLFNYDLTKEFIDSNDLIAEGSSIEPQTSTCNRVLSSGTYYAKVTGDTGKYKVFASYESYDVNDDSAYSYDSPQDLSANFTITGAITETDSEDWFRINITDTETYLFKILSYKSDTKFCIYNEDLSSIVVNENQGIEGTEEIPGQAFYYKELQAGTYYIKVFGATGKYTILWDLLTQENCPHEYDSEIIDPTCTNQGYTFHCCKICEYSYKDEYIEPLGHSYNTVVTAPTCTEKGYTTHQCTVCDESYIDEYTQPTDHNYSATVTAPTCTEKGYTTHKCANCEESYVDEYKDALGHNFSVFVSAPTCTEKGYTSYTCINCGLNYIYNDSNPIGHSFNGGKNCSVCGTLNPDYKEYTTEPNPITDIPAPIVTTPSNQQPSAIEVTNNNTKTDDDAYDFEEEDYDVEDEEDSGDPDEIIVDGKVYRLNAEDEYISTGKNKVKITKMYKGKKAFKVQWKKQESISGYQILYSTSSKFANKNSKKITIKGNKAKNPVKTVKKLKSNTTYYVRVRTYKTVKVNGKSTKVYSSWSKVKTVKTK
ncbi:MAG: fibronectin type III domain-containing protein [Eubacterium sp.]